MPPMLLTCTSRCKIRMSEHAISMASLPSLTRTHQPISASSLCRQSVKTRGGSRGFGGHHCWCSLSASYIIYESKYDQELYRDLFWGGLDGGVYWLVNFFFYIYFFPGVRIDVYRGAGTGDILVSASGGLQRPLCQLRLSRIEEQVTEQEAGLKIV